MTYDALMMRAGALQWALEIVQEQGGNVVAWAYGATRPLSVLATSIHEEIVKLKWEAQRLHDGKLRALEAAE